MYKDLFLVYSGGINSLICQSPAPALRDMVDSPQVSTDKGRGFLYAYRPNMFVGRWVTLLMRIQKKMAAGA